jgi:hypothetical protein
MWESDKAKTSYTTVHALLFGKGCGWPSSKQCVQDTMFEVHTVKTWHSNRASQLSVVISTLHMAR